MYAYLTYTPLSKASNYLLSLYIILYYINLHVVTNSNVTSECMYNEGHKLLQILLISANTWRELFVIL